MNRVNNRILHCSKARASFGWNRGRKTATSTMIPSVKQWLAATHPAFGGGANIGSYHCTRPDLFDDRSIEYVSYSLVRGFAFAVNKFIGQSDAISLTRMLATVSKREANLCIYADKIRDMDELDEPLVDFKKVAREILAISQTSALWPAFEYSELLRGLRRQADEVLNTASAGRRSRSRRVAAQHPSHSARKMNQGCTDED
ncbi:MAG: hypothetical protein KL863_28605 [Rhizobium sp.]|nr:hypothetical protein [Rhizobium sp.]